ncbi:MAG: chorismate mutase [Desulfobacterales bacterium]|nr:MAG: chorismate mutase [Desulfobacterales bacterium]
MDKPNKDNTTDDLNADIRALRKAIDEIDEKILDLINERLLLAAQIGHFKKQCGIQVTDSRREKEIMRRVLEKNNGPLCNDGLRNIFSAIIAEGRNIQRTS